MGHPGAGGTGEGGGISLEDRVGQSRRWSYKVGHPGDRK